MPGHGRKDALGDRLITYITIVISVILAGISTPC